MLVSALHPDRINLRDVELDDNDLFGSVLKVAKSGQVYLQGSAAGWELLDVRVDEAPAGKTLYQGTRQLSGHVVVTTRGLPLAHRPSEYTGPFEAQWGIIARPF